MSVYHLRARRIEGPLMALRRNEMQTREADDWAEAVSLAEELVGHGFTVRIFDHGHPSPFPTTSDYRVAAEFSPARRHDGTRTRLYALPRSRRS